MGNGGDILESDDSSSRSISRSTMVKAGLKRRRTGNNPTKECGSSCSSPSAPLRFRMKPIFFKDDRLTVGGQLKANGQVLKNQLHNSHNRPPNVNCRVEAFGRMCSSFDERRRKWVASMGLEGLLNLVDMFLPRNLCYWLYTRVDAVNRTFIDPNGLEFSLTPNQVGWVLGIPMGKLKVPRVIRGTTMKATVREIDEKYVKEFKYVVKRSGKVISSSCIPITSDMLGRLEGHWDESEMNEFKQLFLIVSLGTVLTPTLNGKLRLGMLAPLSCYKSVKLFDWCSFVLGHLMDSVNSFARKFYRSGYSSGCAGCSIFLAVFYLDRLKRPHVFWGEYPRIRVWTMEEVNKARANDRISSGGDYGQLGCLDIVYGGNHPLKRDDPPPPRDDCNDEIFVDGDSEFFGAHDSVYQGESSSKNITKGLRLKKKKRGRKLNRELGIDKRKVSDKDKDVVGDSNVDSGKQTPMKVIPSKMSKLSIGEEESEMSPSSPVLSFHELLFRGSGGFGIKNNECIVNDCDNMPQEGASLRCDGNVVVQLEVGEDVGVNVEDVFESMGYVDYYEKLVRNLGRLKSVKLAVFQIRDLIGMEEVSLKTKFLAYVRKVGRSSRSLGNDMVLIKCGSHTASLRSCYSVLHCRRGIDDQYVRTVGGLFNKMWNRYNNGGSIRCVLDSVFSARVIQDGNNLATRRVAGIVKFLKEFLFDKKSVSGIVASAFSKIFIPVLTAIGNDSNHWWCVAVCFDEAMVVVMDSNSTNALEDHRDHVDKILSAIETCLSKMDDQWVEGTTLKYTRRSLNMQMQPDIHSCGVFMLTAMFDCAEGIPHKFYLDDISKAREWMLASHFLLHENEAKDEVSKILGVF